MKRIDYKHRIYIRWQIFCINVLSTKRSEKVINLILYPYERIALKMGYCIRWPFFCLLPQRYAGECEKNGQPSKECVDYPKYTVKKFPVAS